MTARLIRKFVTLIEEVHVDADQTIAPPTRKVVVAAVVENPYAGKYVAELDQLVVLGESLGEELAKIGLTALGIQGAEAQSFGKAAMVGEDGELEHAAAILHPKLGSGIRRALGGGKALVPSSKSRGGLGQTLTVPLGHKDAAYVRSHFDAAEITINDAPRRREIVVAVALTDSGRPLARVGGLSVGDIVGEDGQR